MGTFCPTTVVPAAYLCDTGLKDSNIKADTRQLLEAFMQKHRPEFLPADQPALRASPQTSDQVTDFYLAELAQSKGLKLATLDTGINHPAVELIS